MPEDVDAIERSFDVVARPRWLLAEEHVARGSMAPKVEAAARFADFGGTTLMGSLDQVDDLLARRAGTMGVPQAHPLPSGSREHAGKPPRASGLALIAEHAVSSRMRT